MKHLLIVLAVLTLAACVRSGDIRETTSSPKEAARANFALGTEYLKRGELETALASLQKAVEYGPDHAHAHAVLALVYERLALSREAEVHYRRANKLASEDPFVQNYYASFLLRQGEIRVAEKLFLKAARNPRYSTPAVAFTNAGICALSDDRHSDAEDYFRQALRVNPRHTQALWEMAALAGDRERFLQARAFLERLEALTPLPPAALLLGVQVEKELGNARLADDYARRLKQGFPDSREAGELMEWERHGG